LPQEVPDVFLGASALLWAVLVSLYVSQRWRRVLADVRDPVLGPFTSLAVMTPMIPAMVLPRPTWPKGACWSARSRWPRCCWVGS
jgi:hypothetical protein